MTGYEGLKIQMPIFARRAGISMALKASILHSVWQFAESCCTSCMANSVTLDHSHNPANSARIVRGSVLNCRDSSVALQVLKNSIPLDTLLHSGKPWRSQHSWQTMTSSRVCHTPCTEEAQSMSIVQPLLSWFSRCEAMQCTDIAQASTRSDPSWHLTHRLDSGPSPST